LDKSKKNSEPADQAAPCTVRVADPTSLKLFKVPRLYELRKLLACIVIRTLIAK
jgi:hypothetical protein